MWPWIAFQIELVWGKAGIYYKGTNIRFNFDILYLFEIAHVRRHHYERVVKGLLAIYMYKFSRIVSVYGGRTKLIHCNISVNKFNVEQK